MDNKEKICFLVITYNAEPFLDKLFGSIDGKYKIFAVDNGSKDNTLKILDEKKVKYVVNNKNGYAAGVNRGLRFIKDAGYEFAFVLNQDTEIVKFDLDNSLLEKYVVVQPLVLNEDSTVGVDELKMNVYGFVFPHRYKEKSLPVSKEIDFFSGAGFVINVSKFFQIGDFDENYFMYYEDIDYAVRCFLAGEKMFLTDSVNIIHYYKNSVSSSRKMKQLLTSRKIFANKYFTDAWRLLLFISDFQNSRDRISQEEKNIFTKYIIKKTFNGFKTRQVPFLVRAVFNFTMYLYSVTMKLLVSAFLSTENNKNNELR